MPIRVNNDVIRTCCVCVIVSRRGAWSATPNGRHIVKACS